MNFVCAEEGWGGGGGGGGECRECVVFGKIRSVQIRAS